MPAPTISLTTTGSDPKTASLSDLESQVNAGFQALHDLAEARAEKSANLGDLDDATAARGALGLGNVENTSDAAKPVSTAQQAALDSKAASTHQHPAAQISDATPAGRAVLTAADATAQRAALELGNVENTSDAAKPVSTAQQAALDGKAASTHQHPAAQISDATPAGQAVLTAADAAAQRVALGLGNVENTSDAAKPVSTAQQAALDGKAASSHQHPVAQISDATPAGRAVLTAADATAQRVALGLGNVENTSDAAKPVSTAQQAALDGKAASSHQHPAAQISDATPVGRAVLTAADATAQRAALGLEAASLTFDALHRPGLLPSRYAAPGTDAAVSGAPGALQAVDGAAVQRVAGRGDVLRLTDPDAILADRALIILAPGRVTDVFAIVRRVTNTSDPAGDTVRIALRWLREDFSGLGDATLDDVLLTSEMAAWHSSRLVARDDGLGADLLAPAGAAYARLYVKAFGVSGQTDVETLGHQDATRIASLLQSIK